jgi:hypothetical protein
MEVNILLPNGRITAGKDPPSVRDGTFLVEFLEGISDDDDDDDAEKCS